MTENPYDLIMPPTALDRAVDRAVAEENARAYPATAEEEAALDEMAERYVHLEAAERAAGKYGVVIPVELAKALLAGLRNEVTPLTVLSDNLPQRMLQAAVDKTAQRS